MGTFIWPKEKTYYGEYEHDLKHGFGLLRWENGRQFMGYWKNGK